MSTDKAFIDSIDAINTEAWEKRVSDSNHALKLSQKAVALSEKAAYRKGQAEGLRTLGFCHLRLSNNQQALELYKQSLDLFNSLDDVKLQADIMAGMGIIYRNLGDYATSLDYLFKGLNLCKQVAHQEGEALDHYHIGITFKYLGEYSQALDHFLKSLSIAKDKYWIPESYSLNNIGLLYFETGDYTNALDFFNQSLSIRQNFGDKWGEAGCLDSIGEACFKLSKYEDAIAYCSRSLTISESVGDKKGQANAFFHLATIYFQLGKYVLSIDHYNKSLQIREQISDKKGQAEVLYFLSQLYSCSGYKEANPWQAFHFLEKAMLLGKEVKAKDILSKIHFGFYIVYKQLSNYKEALFHMEEYITIEKELHSETITKKIHNAQVTHRLEQAKKEAEIFRLRNIELAALYEESNQQKEEIASQRDHLERTLSELKTRQAQLIQREKMASLGELTAGIAHEIQNPLNFINNFSEVSAEMIEELKEELNKGELAEAKALSEDIKQNLEKIHHHGKRADSIVKAMLQHSRTSSGEKQLIDISALVDEYLRLAYHGLRVKEKDFNADFTLEADPSLGKIEVVPQEIGRVLLNLFNNAFYATAQKKARLNGQYQPQVLVSTNRLADKIEIRVRDNGIGIPESIKSKIFQPFFTTKPTGEGTGLGLSLSYDIITKGHRGELKVETREGEYSEFIVTLPTG